MPLSFTRKHGESVILFDTVSGISSEVVYTKDEKGRVKLTVKADESVIVDRDETVGAYVPHPEFNPCVDLSTERDPKNIGDMGDVLKGNCSDDGEQLRRYRSMMVAGLHAAVQDDELWASLVELRKSFMADRNEAMKASPSKKRMIGETEVIHKRSSRR